MTQAIAVDGLKKTFRQGFFMRRVEAVKGISFHVEAGEIFGFLGPNGAGKTTTIKMLTGLIRKTGLTPRVFVTLSARLSGLSGAHLRTRVEGSLERTGIAYAAERQVRKLSKGMLQRTGLAAAMVSDPDLLLLDEPMSGLDPVGRKEVRDLILEEKRRGKTVFFSTHILNDVETLCDRVVILRRGETVVSGPVRELLRADVRRVEITLQGAPEDLLARFRRDGLSVEMAGGNVTIEIEGEGGVPAVLAAALEAKARVVEVTPRRETLENLFMRRAIDDGQGSESEKLS
jgi:ABC-2 type transport system ATP-binding protein